MDAHARPNINLMDTEVLKCPYDAYSWLRRNEPVHKDELTGMYFITRYDLVRQVVRDTETYSSDVNWVSLREGNQLSRTDKLFEEKGWPQYKGVTLHDEPSHSLRREVLDRAFTPKRIRDMEPQMTEIVDLLIDRFIDNGRCDFMADFAIPLPCMVIADMLGVPREDIGRLKEWTDAFMKRISNMVTDEEEIACVEKLIECQHYFKAHLDDRVKNPREDILTTIVTTTFADGTRPEEFEVVGTPIGLLVGGNETTTSGMTSGMKLLIDHPDQTRRIRENPSLVKNFIEEVLRLESPIQGLYRMTTRDTELAGTFIPKGAAINLRWAAANRDEDTFSDAANFDVERRNAGAHLGFGSGIHHCLGAALARREMQLAFTRIFERMDDFALDAAEVEYVPSLLQRSIRELPIRFTKRG